MLKSRAALLALATAATFAVQAEPLVLAPGKSVTIVDAGDTTVRVVITAPADKALDLDAFFAAADPTRGVQSLATHRQVKSAGVLVRNPDGSLSLGAPSNPGVVSAKSIEGGVIVFGGGSYTLQSEVPESPAATPSLAQDLMTGSDHAPMPARIGDIHGAPPGRRR